LQCGIVTTAGEDQIVTIYKFNPSAVAVVQEQAHSNKILFKQFSSNEEKVIIMFAVGHIRIWGIGSVAPLILIGGTTWR
jgi:hypothetical protein